MLPMEDLATLTELAKGLPGRPHSSTVWRWCRKGVKSRSGDRIQLEHVRIGARVFSSPQAVEQFGRRLADADASHFSQPDDRNIHSPLPGNFR